MQPEISAELFGKQLYPLLRETFEKVEGIYLDRGASLLETLAAISSSEASKPTVNGSSTIAGHVDHVRFYLRILNDYMDGKWYEKLDWKQSWLTSQVSESEWDNLRKQVETDYQQLFAHLKGFDNWNDEKRLGGAMAIVVHTAFHLGAIRQMMLVVKKGE